MDSMAETLMSILDMNISDVKMGFDLWRGWVKTLRRSRVRLEWIRWKRCTIWLGLLVVVCYCEGGRGAFKEVCVCVEDESE